jgi:hypothetical protein
MSYELYEKRFLDLKRMFETPKNATPSRSIEVGSVTMAQPTAPMLGSKL